MGLKDLEIIGFFNGSLVGLLVDLLALKKEQEKTEVVDGREQSH